MGSQTEPVPQDSPAHASTAKVVATMGVIALVAVLLVVGSARLGRGAEDDDAVQQEEVPTSLVGGIEPARVPRAIRAAVDLPVIAARALGPDEVPPDVLDACSGSFGDIVWDDAGPKLQYAVATPDQISAAMVGAGTFVEGGFEMGGQQPERFRVACAAQMRDGNWETQNTDFEPLFAGEQPAINMGGEFSCCDADGLGTASATVKVPKGATWALQQQGNWYLAYPTGGQRKLRVTWKFRDGAIGGDGPPSTSVSFFDRNGNDLGEQSTGEAF